MADELRDEAVRGREGQPRAASDRAQRQLRCLGAELLEDPHCPFEDGLT
jgi:hypothetical protein